MKEYCHDSLPWYSLGTIEKRSSGWTLCDLLVRWNETTETRDGPDGPETQYVYDAHRFNIVLPVEVQPGIESVEYYLSQAEDAIIAQAQARLLQEEGFDADG